MDTLAVSVSQDEGIITDTHSHSIHHGIITASSGRSVNTVSVIIENLIRVVTDTNASLKGLVVLTDDFFTELGGAQSESISTFTVQLVGSGNFVLSTHSFTFISSGVSFVAEFAKTERFDGASEHGSDGDFVLEGAVTVVSGLAHGHGQKGSTEEKLELH